MNKGFTKEDTEITKGIAILMMLMHHLYAYPDRVSDVFQVNTGSFYFLLARFGRLCVPVFTMIAGYGMYCSYQSGKSQKELINKRLRRLYQMVLMTALIFFSIGIFLHVYSLHPFSQFLRNLLLTLTGIDPVMNQEWWYLWLYILLIVLAPFLLKMVSRLHEIGNLVVIFLFCMAVTYIPLSTGLLVIDRTIFVLTWGISPYLTGASCAKYHVFEKLRSVRNLLLIPISTILLIISFLLFLNWKDTPFMDTIYTFSILLFSTAVLEKIPGIRRFLSTLGNNSGWMWLNHTFFAYYLFQKETFLSGNAYINWIWLTVLSLAAAAVIRTLSNALSCHKKRALS